MTTLAFASSAIAPAPHDVARADLEHAAGLPGSEGLDAAKCLRWVEEAARLVAYKTQGYFYQLRERPEEFEYSEGRFRMGWLVTVLQRDLGVRYDMDSIPLADDDFFKRADHLFIHGIIQGKGGTCSSLPTLYAAVGRRLGYPLRLVPCKRHGFLRWEGGRERFNIEPTCRGFVSRPDEHYLTWPESATPEQVKRYRLLESLTPEEEVARLMRSRGHVLMANGRYADANWVYVAAYHKAPGREAILDCVNDCVQRWGAHLRSQIGAGFPGITIADGPYRHRDFSLGLTAEINYLNALDLLLNDPVRKARWWEPLRRDPRSRPPGMPEWLRITYLPPPDGGLKVEPCAPPQRRAAP